MNTLSPTAAVQAAAPVHAAQRPRPRASGSARRLLLGIGGIVVGLVVWQLVSQATNPLFLPSPLLVWQAFKEMAVDGSLWASTLASAGRILIGWSLGMIIGIPLGILMGHFQLVREALDPYIEFFRFIPPIAFVTLAVIWMGPGELSKVALILYTTVFIVTINVIAGVLSVSELRLRAAQSLGASRLQTLRTVVVPSTVPYMVTGARLAMGNSFLTIVSAEIVASQVGLGAMIWTARNYGRTEWVFVGIIVLGALGFLFDRLLRLVVRQTLQRYGASV